MGHLKSIEVEVGDSAIAVSSGPIDYWLQDDVPQWWLAALWSEAQDNYYLRQYLRNVGIISITSQVNDAVCTLRDAIVEEYTRSWLD